MFLMVSVYNCIPCQSFYTKVTIFVFEDHRVITSISFEFNDLTVLTHFINIQNRSHWSSFPGEPTASEDLRNLNRFTLLCIDTCLIECIIIITICVIVRALSWI